MDIDGNIIMKLFGIRPGPVIGKVLNELLELVLDSPEMNERNTLVVEARRIYSEIEENNS